MIRHSHIIAPTIALNAGRCLGVLLPLLICGLATGAHAQIYNIYNWNDGDGTQIWSDPGNWDVGAPASDPTNQLNFGGTDGLTNTNDLGTLQLNALVFQKDAGAFNISGGKLQFLNNPNLSGSSAAPTITEYTSASITLNNALELDNALLVRGAGGATGSLTLTGQITGAAGLASANYLTILSNGTNSYQGGTTVAAGTLQLGADNAVPLGSNLILNGSSAGNSTNVSTFALNGHQQTIGNLTLGDGADARTLVIQGTGTLTLNGTLTYNGTTNNLMPLASINSNLALSNIQHTFQLPKSHSKDSYDVVASGLISGAGGIVLTEGIRVALTHADNTYLGETNVSAGSLYLAAQNAVGGGSLTLGNTGTAYLYIDQIQTGVPTGVYNQTIGSLSGSGNVELGSTGTTVTGGATLTLGTDNTNTSFTGTIADNGQGGSVTKTGSGTWTLGGTGAVTLSGTYTQAAGVTQLDGKMTLTNDLQLTGGDLVGTGTLTGGVNNTGGRIHPGDLLPTAVVGTLALSGNYTQSSAGKMLIDLGSSGYDVLQVGGTASLAGELDINLLNGYQPLLNQTFNILTYGTETGNFSTILSLDPNYGYSLSFSNGIGTLKVVSTAAVPETSTLCIAGLMLACGALRLRRERQRAGQSRG